MISFVVAALVAATPISLEDVRTASRHATVAQLSELDRQRAAEQVTVARSGLLPQVGLTLATGFTAQGPKRFRENVQVSPGVFEEQTVDIDSTARGGFQLSLGVRQLLFDATTWANLSVASAQFDAAAAQAAEDRLNAELEGIRRFFDLIRAQKTQGVIEQRVKSSTELAERAEALFQAGRRRKEDAIAARINLGNDRTAQARQQVVITQASALLASYIGRSPSEPLVAQEGQSVSAGTGVPAFEEALAQAKENRPQLAAMEALTQAAREAVAGARGAYLPSADVSVSYDRNSPQLGPFFDVTRQHSVSATLGIRWDIFNGFVTNAQVGQAKVAEQRALVQLEQARRDVEADLKTRIDTLRVAQQVTTIAEDNLKLAQDNLHLAQTRFEEGAGSTLEIRDAQDKHATAELSVIESRIDLELARAGLERAIGAFGPGVAQ